MDNKIKFESNMIEVIKTDKGYDVKITADKNVDVYMNQECIYSEYESDSYKYVPINMRDFIKENAYDIGYNDGGDIDGSYVEINILGRDITMYFPRNKTKKIHARYTLTDPLKDVLYLMDEFEYENEQELILAKEKVTNLYNNMIKGLKDLGFKLEYSHSMGESFWGWHDLVFNANNFNEEKFIKASEIIFKYDDDFGKLAKEYNWI